MRRDRYKKTAKTKQLKAETKSFVGKAIITWVLYYIGVYVVGLIVNLAFLSKAKKIKKKTGKNPKGKGFLLILLLVHLIIPVLFILAVAGVVQVPLLEQTPLMGFFNPEGKQRVKIIENQINPQLERANELLEESKKLDAEDMVKPLIKKFEKIKEKLEDKESEVNLNKIKIKLVNLKNKMVALESDIKNITNTGKELENFTNTVKEFKEKYTDEIQKIYREKREFQNRFVKEDALKRLKDLEKYTSEEIDSIEEKIKAIYEKLEHAKTIEELTQVITDILKIETLWALAETYHNEEISRIAKIKDIEKGEVTPPRDDICKGEIVLKSKAKVISYYKSALPAQFSGQNLRAYIVVFVDKNSQPKDITLQKSSGNADFDNMVIERVKKCKFKSVMVYCKEDPDKKSIPTESSKHSKVLVQSSQVIK